MIDEDLRVGLGATIAVKPGAPARDPRPTPVAPELARGTLIDRYVVVDRLGAGGMGVVYAAYDPELGRKVALKFLRVDPRREADTDARTRLLREAQALAKLSHPNVVAVFDVGTSDGTVWLAMEFLEGETLGAWRRLRPRGWEEVRTVMLEAGRGLAAAHRAGLVHRDFKPDNVMVSRDGRVRVMDLGLARLGTDSILARPLTDADLPEMTALTMRVTQVGTVVGTPYYMAPEQFHGAELIDATADVFAFCVTFWEVLFGERPFAGEDVQDLLASIRAGRPRPGPRSGPAWVRGVLARGLHVDPRERWPSMDALLAALGRDPRAARRWLAAGVSAAALVGAGYGYALTGEDTPCSFAAEELREVWGPQQRAAVARALDATGVAYAGAVTATSAGHLDRYSEGWIAAHTAACEAHRRGTTSAELFDRRMACLRQRRTELRATVAVLSQVTAAGVDHVVDAAAGIPEVARCEDDARLLASDPLADDPGRAGERERIREVFARGQALERGGRYQEAMTAVAPTQAAVEALADPGLVAELHLLLGTLHMRLEHGPEALAAVETAARTGLRWGADAVAAEALTVQVFVLAEQLGRLLDALTIAGLAESLVARVGSPPDLEALLHNNVGAVRWQMGDADGAIAAYERGLEILAGTDEPIYWILANNLAVQLDYVGQHARLQGFLTPIRGRFVALHGECHPFAANMRWVIAASLAKTGRFADATADLERAVQCVEGRLPAMTIELLGALAEVYLLRGDEAEVRRQVERGEVIAAASPEARAQLKVFTLARAELELRAERWDAARAILERGEATIAAGEGSMRLVPYATRLAIVAEATGDAAAALARIRRAGALLRPGLPSEERALWHFTNARILRRSGAAPPEVAAQLDEAAANYRIAGEAFAPRIAEIEAWRAGSR